jgi:hypothetical protein
LLLQSLVQQALLAAFLQPVLRNALLHALLHALLSAAGLRSMRAVRFEGRMTYAKCGCCLAAAVVVLAAAGRAEAARLRYHYGPADNGGTMILRPVNCGASGERLSLTLRWEPYNCPPPHATRLVTFCHPCTKRNIIIPLSLPLDTPVMEYRANRTIYNYGTHTVEIHFLADGTADVIYTSGTFRAP